MSANTNFNHPDGAHCPVYDTAAASGRDAPGVVVLQEWRGRNDQIRRTADRLAAADDRALVPDLYRGDLALDAAEAEHRMDVLDFADAEAADLAWRRSLDFFGRHLHSARRPRGDRTPVSRAAAAAVTRQTRSNRYRRSHELMTRKYAVYSVRLVDR